MATRRGMGTASSTLRRPTPVTNSAGGDHSLVAALAGSASELGQAFQMVKVAEVTEHPQNPRDGLGDLTELAQSIRELGLRQPITVIPASAFRAAHPELPLVAEARWVPLDGHRRRAAAQLAGVTEIPAWIRGDLNGAADGPETFLVTNLHRLPLSPLEEARAMALLAELGRSQRQIAERTGFTQSHVSKRLSLLRLPQPVQDAVARDDLTVGDALAITGVPAEDQLAVFELARQQRLPVTSAVHALERERGEAAAREKARQRAAREKLRFLERPSAEFADPWAHRLSSKAEVEAARQAGTLVASVDAGGVFAYYSTAPRRSPGNDEEKQRRAACTARSAAAQQLVGHKPAAREVADALADAVLRDRVPYADALRLTHKWLGDSVGITDPDMYRWRDSVVAADAATRSWVAWAMTVAAAEARLRWRNRRWDRDDAAYLERLATATGYVPTEWEKEQLAAIAEPSGDESDSDGITAAGEG